MHQGSAGVEEEITCCFVVNINLMMAYICMVSIVALLQESC